MTTYLLNEIDKEDYTTSELREKFVDSYVVNQRAVERRLEEQKVIGLVAGGEKIKLTGGGHIFLQLMEWIKKVYRIDRR